MTETLEQIFGKSTHIQLILLFYNNRGYLNNIAGLAKMLGKSHVTIRKAVSDLIEAGIFDEKIIGKSRMIKLNENSPYTKALLSFINTMNELDSSQPCRVKIPAR